MTPSAKIDLFKSLKSEYAAPKKPAIIETTAGRYLTIEGQGQPGDETFSDHVAALYGIAYTIKMRRKSTGGQDYVIGKLEVVWLNLRADHKATDWHWKIMIRTPDFIEQSHLDSAVAVLLDKKKPPTVREVKLTTLHEGTCVQMLHVGPYDDEPTTVAVMLAHANAKGYESAGDHHDIYLSDPRRVAPARLKTIVRRPVELSA